MFLNITASQLTPDRQVQLPAVQDGEKASHSRTRVRGEPKKQQKQETSDASVSATMGPPRTSTKGENSEPRVNWARHTWLHQSCILLLFIKGYQFL